MQPSQHDFDIEVRPGFVLLLISMILAHTYFYWAIGIRLGFETSPLVALNWGCGVTLLVLLGTVVHELGHVVAGVLAGHRWVKAVLTGAGLGVAIEPQPAGWDRIVRSLSGPLAQFLVAVPLFGIATLLSPSGTLLPDEALASPWWIAAMGNLFLAVFNLLPIPGADGFKVAQGVWELVGPRRRLAISRD